MSHRVDQMHKILQNLRQSPDVEATALMSEDGLMIASVLPASTDEGCIAGMTATLSSLGARAAAELQRGQVQEVLIRGSEGYAIMSTAGRGGLLLALTGPQAKLGLTFLDMRRAAADLANIL